MIELFTQCFDGNDTRQGNARGAVNESGSDSDLGMAVEDHLPHQKLVEIIVQPATNDWIVVVVQMVYSALCEIHDFISSRF